jgi:hypothetical protein
MERYSTDIIASMFSVRGGVDVDALPREIVMQTDLKHVDEAPLG